MKVLKKIDHPILGILIILLIYVTSTLAIWRKYNWNPSSLVHFGLEFAERNRKDTPRGVVVELGNPNDLGAGYDGQIFYYYSRTISKLSQNWPKGFDESYRAPRIGYPLLISIFGFLGEWWAIFGMYFWNLFLFCISYLALREILGREYSYLSLFYILSPFSLGSYLVLVSDSVMSSLVIVAYFFFIKRHYELFILTSSLAILTKEPVIFLLFPLGLYQLVYKKWKEAIIVVATLIIPTAWHLYLRFTFPNWTPTRLLDFIQPLDGILGYLNYAWNELQNLSSFKDLPRVLSRFLLVVLLVIGVGSLLKIPLKNAWMFQLGLLLNFFMILTASYYHFWSVYENISRMFTISIPLTIFYEKEDPAFTKKIYLWFSVLIFIIFSIRTIFLQSPQNYITWQGEP
ncbi:MAG: hypothetical protein N3A69_09880 [Leptospiraceae bacterium]|nr:hypothetical protein [Leptospiraceae bacterium]